MILEFMGEKKHNGKLGSGREPMSRVSFTIVVVFLAVVGGFFAFQNRSAAPEDGGQGESAQSEEEPATGVIEPINSRELMDFLGRGDTGFLFVGSDGCPNCQAFERILREVLAEREMTVWYFNTDANRGDANFVDALDAIKFKSVPSFVYLRGGKVAGRLANLANKQALVEFVEKNS